MKELIIEISPDILSVLHESNYVLCVAKKVEDYDYNVIWQAQRDFTEMNKITWEDKYNIFASTFIKDREELIQIISPINISHGEQAVLSKDGFFSEKSQGKTLDNIEMLNQYKPVYPGISQECTNFNNETLMQPIFVCPDMCVPGEFRTKVVDSLRIWFEQNVKAGMYFEASVRNYNQASSNIIEVDLTENSSARIRYEEYNWKNL